MGNTFSVFVDRSHVTGKAFIPFHFGRDGYRQKIFIFTFDKDGILKVKTRREQHYKHQSTKKELDKRLDLGCWGKIVREQSKVLYYLILVASLSLVLTSCAVAPLIGSRLEHEKLTDGVYEGSYRSLPNSAVVRVTIAEGRIVNVELVKQFASWKGKKVGEVIPRRIVSEQSTRVDAVTGATNSSRVIMNAVQRAVEKAYK